MSKKIVTRLLDYASQEGVKDLIISSQAQHIALDCYLTNGTKRALTLPKKLEQEFFTNLRRVLTVLPGELMTQAYRKISTKTGDINVYLTILPDKFQEKIIINIVNRPPEVWRLNQLGLRTIDLREVKTIIKRPSGLIIVASPPGGGKSSTLYALLTAINDPAKNIYLLAKNPPYIIPGINLLDPTPSNWERIRKHDAEIILADSLDEDWMLAQALTTAATGRLVIGTLTAASGAAALKNLNRRIKPEELKTANLKMIISQRLIKLKRPLDKQSVRDRQTIGSFAILKSLR